MRVWCECGAGVGRAQGEYGSSMVRNRRVNRLNVVPSPRSVKTLENLLQFGTNLILETVEFLLNVLNLLGLLELSVLKRLYYGHLVHILGEFGVLW